jgi:AAA domain
MMPADAFAEATFCEVCHQENCEGHLAAESAEAPDKRPRLAAIRALDVIGAPRPVEIIEGIAWAGCLTVLVAESGAGKTFVLLDASAAVSADVAWHGRATVQGSVAYISYEGDALELRLRALRDITGRTEASSSRVNRGSIVNVDGHDEQDLRCPNCGEDRRVEWDDVIFRFICGVCSRTWRRRLRDRHIPPLGRLPGTVAPLALDSELPTDRELKPRRGRTFR